MAIDQLSKFADIDIWSEGYQLPKEELRRRATNVQGLLTMSDDRIDAELLQHCKNLRVVANMAAGFNNLDLKELTLRGIPAGNTPGVLTEATADLTFAILLACARKLVDGRDALLEGRWDRWDPEFCLGMELSGATLGIVGTGKIGKAVARRANAFNLNVLGWSRSQEPIEGLSYVSFEELLTKSDIVSLHVALTEHTHHLIGQRSFS
jgi:glyoxylate reductase